MSIEDLYGNSILGKIEPLLGWKNSWPNRLRQNFTTILDSADKENFPGAIIPVYENNSMAYYAAVNEDPEEWRELITLLNSFVGKTITDITISSNITPLNSTMKKELEDNNVSLSTRFRPTRDTAEYCCESLVRLVSLTDTKRFTKRRPRTTSEVLHSFDKALVAGNLESGYSDIEYLRANFRLEPKNFHFMEVRLLASQGQWRKISQLSFLNQLYDLDNLPLSIIRDLTESLYWCWFLENFDSFESNVQLIHTFKNDVLQNTGLLFTNYVEPIGPYAGTMFALAAVSSTPEDANVLNRLVLESSSWPDEQKNILTKIIEPDNYQITSDDAENITVLCSHEPVTLEIGQKILTKISNSSSLNDKILAHETLDKMSEIDKEQMLANPLYGEYFKNIKKTRLRNNQPSNWIDLLQNASSMESEEILENIRLAVDEWPLNQQLTTHDSIQNFISGLEQLHQQNNHVTRQLVTLITNWILKDYETKEKLYIPLYLGNIDNIILLLHDSWDSNLFQAMLDLISGLLEIGIGDDKYTQTLSDVRDCLPQALGLSDINLLLTLLEIILNFSTNSKDIRESLWSVCYSSIYPFRSQLTNSQRLIANNVAEAFGFRNSFDVEDSEGAPIYNEVSLAGKSIAIYTLLDGVGKRSKETLENLYPGVSVTIINDKVNSDAIKHLAPNADIFVICWAAAAHQAVGAISNLRPDSKTTLYPNGKGSSSILKAIETHVINDIEQPQVVF